jgi:hypothetical protein
VSGSAGGTGSERAGVDVSCVRESIEVRSSGGEEFSGALLESLMPCIDGEYLVSASLVS